MIKNKYNLASISAVLFSFAALALNGCGKNSDKVIAQAGPVKITRSDFSKELVNSPPAYQNYLGTLEGKKQFLDILLKEKILLNAAEKSGISNKQEFQKNVKYYEEHMKDQLVEYRKGLILREYLRELKDGELKVLDPEVKSYYDQKKDEFQSPTKVSASHILCLSNEEAQGALARIKKGEDFAKVAREVSKDPTASRGGLIGEVSRGDLSDLPEFESKLFALKSGQVSDVIQTKMGYHIIKKNNEARLPSQTFEEAMPHIRRILEKQKFDQWIEKAKKDQKVWVDDKLLASIPAPSAPS